jgi:hypothetical protein
MWMLPCQHATCPDTELGVRKLPRRRRRHDYEIDICCSLSEGWITGTEGGLFMVVRLGTARDDVVRSRVHEALNPRRRGK